MKRQFCTAALVAAAAIQAVAQAPRPDQMANMQVIAQSLGVRCEHCHSAERGSGQPEPKKDIARAMMAMTRDLNAKIEAATGKPPTATTRVECVTCHRGVAIPRQLSDIVTQTIREKGVGAAMEQYRDLRKQYYGRQAYDFGEEVVLNIAQQMASGKPDDAIALLKMNLEFNPRSVRSFSSLAYAYTRKLDDATAMNYLEKALEIEPENGVVRGQLEQLKSYQRKR